MPTSPLRRAARRWAGATVAALLVAPLGACSLLNPPDLVIYNAQHEELLDEIVPLFEEESGLDVELRSGSDLEMANQIVEEGSDSPADVFLTENSPAMSIVDNAGLFAPVPQEARDNIPAAVRRRLGQLDRLPGPLDGGHVQHRQRHRGRHAGLASSTSPTPSGRAASASPPPAPTSRPSSRRSSSSRARTPPAPGWRA